MKQIFVESDFEWYVASEKYAKAIMHVVYEALLIIYPFVWSIKIKICF